MINAGADIFDMFRGFEGFIEFDDLKRRHPPCSLDPHPAADEFIAADGPTRKALRKRYRLEYQRRLAAARCAPRPLSKEMRPDKLTPKIRQYIRASVKVGVSIRELAKRLNVARATVSRGLREAKKRGRKPCK